MFSIARMLDLRTAEVRKCKNSVCSAHTATIGAAAEPLGGLPEGVCNPVPQYQCFCFVRILVRGSHLLCVPYGTAEISCVLSRFHMLESSLMCLGLLQF